MTGDGDRRAGALLGVARGLGAAFVGLGLAATSVYPGGTWDDPTTRGFQWLHNYLCDLMVSPAINGEPNPLGQCLGVLALASLAGGLAARCLGVQQRALPGPRRWIASAALAALIASPSIPLTLLPGWRSLHAAAIVATVAPACVAMGTAVGVEWRRRREVAGALGALALLLSAYSTGTFLHCTNVLGGMCPPQVPMSQKLASVLAVLWVFRPGAGPWRSVSGDSGTP